MKYRKNKEGFEMKEKVRYTKERMMAEVLPLYPELTGKIAIEEIGTNEGVRVSYRGFSADVTEQCGAVELVKGICFGIKYPLAADSMVIEEKPKGGVWKLRIAGEVVSTGTHRKDIEAFKKGFLMATTE